MVTVTAAWSPRLAMCGPGDTPGGESFFFSVAVKKAEEGRVFFFFCFFWGGAWGVRG